MAAVRDPAFWRRFSTAVHMDEEQATVSEISSTSTTGSKSRAKTEQSWLERNTRKRKMSWVYGCSIVFGIVCVILAIVFVLLWYTKNGPWAPDPQTSSKTP